ncbi:hypothetical protein EI94DRAFT_1745470 [Lactarius quietus]|nr:hypothetical protein EI94DRAFT_1745470 [Lactarius quietus]
MEASPRVYQPRFSFDDINISSSTTDDIPETDSFVYNPSFASSDTSIASYKTEKTVNSRKSRYNALPRHKYADVGRLRLPQGPVSLDVVVPKTELRDESFSSPLRTFPVRDIHQPNLVQESRPSTRSDSFPIPSTPTLRSPPETVKVEHEDTTSDEDETDSHTPSTPTDQSTPPRVFTSSSFRALHISLSSAGSSALVLEVSTSQPASVTLCATCAQPLRGETVFAFGSIHHFSCFKCIDCGVIVASNFFTVESGGGQRPLCEADHVRRSNDLCDKCGLSVGGNYVTALDKQWHLEHFTCTICSTVLAPTDSHHEHERQLYCRRHFLTSFAMMKCTSCSSEILKDYVKTSDDGCWHLECYMIRKTRSCNSITFGRRSNNKWKVFGGIDAPAFFSVLNTYEKENAACIYDVLREVTNRRYVPAVRMLERLVLSVEALFAATDDLEYKFAFLNATGEPHAKLARVLCHGIFEVFAFVSRHQSAKSMEKRAAATIEILKVVAGIARCFNRLIRVTLKGGLKLQHEHYVLGALPSFLDKLRALANVDSSGHSPAVAATSSASVSDADTGEVNPATSSSSYGYRSLTPENAGISPLAKTQKKYKPPSDLCVKCKLNIAEACVRLSTYQRWHSHCLRCQSCNKTAGLSSTGPGTASTAQVDASNFLYEPMSIENVPLLGPVPNLVYCTDHAWPTSRSGFLPVSRLEQYAFLLMVSLRRLYASLKNPTLPSQTFANPWDANGRKTERTGARNGDLVHVE